MSKRKTLPFVPGLIVATLLLMLGVLVLPFIEFVMYPVHNLVSNEPSCEGAEVFVDGRQRLTITEGGDVLHFKRGWHKVEVRKQGYQAASVRFRATDWEQGSTTSFHVGRSGAGTARKLTLEIE